MKYYSNVSKTYHLGEGKLISVDQSSCDEDKTCLCLAKIKDRKMIIKEIQYIEKQEDMDKYINRNLAKFDRVFESDNLE